MTRVARWRRGRSLRTFALLLAGLVVVGVGAAIASPPPSAAFYDLDGRTWIAVPKADGTQLLLVNGISGLIEGEVTLDDAGPAPAFLGAGRGHTLLSGGDGLVVVDDADQQASMLPALPPAAAIVGEALLVVDGDRGEVSLRGIDGDAPARRLEAAPAPADGAVPVVDGGGRAWYLGARGGRTLAAAVAVDGSVTEVDVDPATTRLLVVDGVTHSESPAGVRAVGGASTLEPPAPGGVAPVVAEATGGVWATAEGSAVRTGADPPQDVGAPVEAVAVWHGQVVVITDAGALLGEPGALTPVPEVGGGASVHRDGGLLWITTPETAVAVDRDHDLTVLRVADVDLSLCVGDCSAAAASRFLEESVTTTTAAPKRQPGPSATTTTSTPRRLDGAAVPPTLGNVTTTTPARAADSATTTAAPSATTVAPPAEPEVVATTVAATPPPTEPPKGDDNGNGNGNGNGDRPPGEDRPPRRDPLPLPLPVPAPETTTTEGPPPEPEPRPEPEPTPADVGLEFEVVGGTVSAEASVRVLGSATDCGVGDERRTTATFTWQGSGSGSRDAAVTWSGSGNRSDLARATLAPIPAGDVTVRVTVCGVAAERETTVRPLVTTTTTPPTTVPPTTTTTPPTTRPPSTTTPTVPTTPTTRPPTTTAPSTTVPPPTTTTTRSTTTTSSAGPPTP